MMNSIEKLIAQKCPDGVEYKKISDVYKRLRGTVITAGKMKEIEDEDGEIRIFAGGKTVVNAKEDDIPNANVVRVPAVLVQSRGVIDFVFYDKPFTFKNEMWAYTSDNVVSTKYLFYILKKDEKHFRKIAESMGSMPQISLPVTEDFEIPVPPIEVQQEIVRILDKLTELEAKLTEELEARKKQYEEYRNLFISEGNEVALSDVAEYVKERVNASGVDDETYVSVENLLPDRGGKILAEHTPTEGKIAGFRKSDVLVGNIRPYLKKIWYADCDGGTNGDVLVIRSKDETTLLAKYLYFVLSSDAFFAYDSQNVKEGKMPRGNKDVIMKYSFCIPSLQRQKEIIEALDLLNTLCNDTEKGLPAEIAARHKQYEYYRDKFLTFERKAV